MARPFWVQELASLLLHGGGFVAKSTNQGHAGSTLLAPVPLMSRALLQDSESADPQSCSKGSTRLPGWRWTATDRAGESPPASVHVSGDQMGLAVTHEESLPTLWEQLPKCRGAGEGRVAERVLCWSSIVGKDFLPSRRWHCDPGVPWCCSCTRRTARSMGSSCMPEERSTQTSRPSAKRSKGYVRGSFVQTETRHVQFKSPPSLGPGNGLEAGSVSP